jgi:hypothetical protein
MQTNETDVKTIVREHQWIEKPGHQDSIFDERKCSVCFLDDRRMRRDAKYAQFHKDWGVTTPCIEPVPDHVSKEEFLKELEQHRVRQWPLLVGLPGDWQIGFSIGSGGYHLYPTIKTDLPEHGFSLLLIWLRARQYDVRRYSDFDYQEKLNTPQYHDDDD